MTTPEVGKVYYRKGKAGRALVVRVTAVGEWIDYRVLHGPRRAMAIGVGRCKARSFERWEPIEERDGYAHLDGCTIFPTFLVLDTQGEPILRCSQKRATFYQKKGFVREVADGVLQFTDAQTERRLRELYPGTFTEFFLAVKNDRCVCCGTATNLTRHHVVPRRHKAKIPSRWRKCISNILFVCEACHQRYEATPEPDPEYAGEWQEYAQRWKRHFVETLQPRYMPAGWDIVSMRPLDEPDGPES